MQQKVFELTVLSGFNVPKYVKVVVKRKLRLSSQLRNNDSFYGELLFLAQCIDKTENNSDAVNIFIIEPKTLLKILEKLQLVLKICLKFRNFNFINMNQRR